MKIRPRRELQKKELKERKLKVRLPPLDLQATCERRLPIARRRDELVLQAQLVRLARSPRNRVQPVL